MEKLTPWDRHHLAFATGWTELGNPTEAQLELTKVSPEAAGHPDVLEVQWAVAATARDWRQALEVAQKLIEAEPGRASGWLHRAYALRRVSADGLTSAWETLLQAVQEFPNEPTISYNLACYACQRGRLDEARGWLDRARKIAEASVIKKMALKDEDLKPLWMEVSSW